MKSKLLIEIKRNRTYSFKDRTLGQYFIDKTYICDTLEDRERLFWTAVEGKKPKLEGKKVYGETAFPTGSYKGVYTKTKGFGNIILLLNVPQFQGIIAGHKGNYISDTLGCVIVGKIDPKTGNIAGGTSTPAFKKLTDIFSSKLKIGDIVDVIVS